MVEDDTADINFIIFRKLAQQLIRTLAFNLATNPRSNKFVLPNVIEKILDCFYTFQIMFGQQYGEDANHNF